MRRNNNRRVVQQWMGMEERLSELAVGRGFLFSSAAVVMSSWAFGCGG